MNLIGFINDQNTQLSAFPSEFDNWNARIAVRAVLMREDSKIALMYIGKYDVYKLPGGGVDEEENLEAAFVREMKEETGCQAKATADLGVFVEERDKWGMLHISFCYLAKVIEKGVLDLTQEEKDESFALQWYSIDEAIELISHSKSDRYDDKYIRMRDTKILMDAQRLLEK